MTETTETYSTVTEVPRRRHPFVNFVVRLVREKPLGTVGAVIVLAMLFVGVFSEFVAPYRINEMHLNARMLPPSATWKLGTDMLGHDMLSQVIYGARVSMTIGLSAAALSTFISTAIGLTSGYIGGKVDLVVQRFVDAWICFPTLILYLTLMGLIGSGYVQLICVLGIGGGIGGSRGARALAFWVKESAYFEAVRGIGGTTRRVILRHLLPNVLPMLIVSLTMGIGGYVLAEASLSFLGLGLPPDVPSWGGMISGSGRIHIESAPWLVLWPGFALTLTVFGLNMFGDALRDLLDPRMRGGTGGIGGRGEKLARRALKKRLAKPDSARH
jgi:peptide/nickel transport system permease protein